MRTHRRKIRVLLFLILFSGLFNFVSSVFASDDLIEVPAVVGMAPRVGFDDNDEVLFVLHGSLPNFCYEVGPTKVERDPLSSAVITLRQYARKKADKLCVEEAILPAHMKFQVPYTTEVSLGRLSAGDYIVKYQKPAGQVGIRMLSVAVATTLSIDTQPYAATSNAMVSDMINGLDEVKVTLNGILTNSCSELTDEIRIERVDDVFVILPVLNIKSGVFCAQYIRPFSRELNLGRLPPGHYLAHVRSMNGKAINRVFQVAK